MNKYDLKIYSKENRDNPVEFIVKNHYNVTRQQLKNLYKPEKVEVTNQKNSHIKSSSKNNFQFIHSKREQITEKGLIKPSDQDFLQMDLLGVEIK